MLVLNTTLTQFYSFSLGCYCLWDYFFYSILHMTSSAISNIATIFFLDYDHNFNFNFYDFTIPAKSNIIT